MDLTFSDGAGVRSSIPNSKKMIGLVDAVPVSEHQRNETLVHEDDNDSKDTYKTPKTLDARSNKTPKDTTVHLVRENETIKKNDSLVNVNVSKGSTDANVPGTKPPLLGRPSGSHYKVGDPPRRPRKPVWLEILCNVFTVRMFISSRCV